MRGSVRGVLLQSTVRGPVCGLVVIDVGRVGDGRGRSGTAAPAARDLVVVDAGRVGDCRGTMAPAVLGLVVIDVAASATVVAMVGRRRPPLATSSSSTPASSTSSLRVSASRPPLMAATAFVQSTAASPLLAFLRGVQSAGSSLGVMPAISGSLTLSIQAAWGGLRRGDPKLFEIFISNPFFLVFFSADVAKATAPAAPPTTTSI